MNHREQNAGYVAPTNPFIFPSMVMRHHVPLLFAGTLVLICPGNK